MPENCYSVEVTSHRDGDGHANFLIRPALKYISPEAAAGLTDVVRRIILERMDPDEANDLHLAIYHNLADGSATVGFAAFEGLRRATGVIVLQQALELCLNGTLDHVSPTSPARG